MQKIENEGMYPYLESEDELAFAKGCYAGIALAIPIWTTIVLTIKFLFLKH